MTAAKSVPDSRDALWIAGIFLVYAFFWGATAGVQPVLIPGDMGRDLYAFQQTCLGDRPCRDYWWQYGPLMPVYYAFWFLLGGINLASVRMGLGVILFLCALLTYRALRLFVSPPAAFVPALGFLSLDILYTFNHVGAFPFILMSTYCLWRFFLSREIKWLYLAVPALIAVAAVKISAGLASFSAFMTIVCADRVLSLKESRPIPLCIWLRHAFFLALIFTAAVAGIYYWVYRGLSFSQVDHCLSLTIGQDYREKWGLTPLENMKNLIQWFLVWDRARLIAAISFCALGLLGLGGLKRKKHQVQSGAVLFRVLGVCVLMGLANAADYFVDGKIHRFDFWIFPMLILMLGLFSQWAAFLFPPRVKFYLWLLVFLCVLWYPFQNLVQAAPFRVSGRYLDVPHGKVYVGGILSNAMVFKKAARYIADNTSPDDTILAIPYDALYCFLAGRRHAVRELMFMEHTQVSEKEEDVMIREIEAKRPPLFLLSNRYRSEEPGMGYFGETHYRKLAKYLFEHYREVQTFGPWDGEPAGLHAVKIFKRI